MRSLLRNISIPSLITYNSNLSNGCRTLYFTRRMSLMRAVVANDTGGVEVVQRPIPKPNHDEELIKIAAIGVNRADLLQIAGKYPPPSGTTDILGLEASGYLPNGQLVSMLLKGGGFAEYVVTPKTSILRFPKASSLLTPTILAAIPEAFLAAYHVMFQIGNLKQNETVLINAAASGVGTSAIQLACATPGVHIIGSVGSEEKVKVCKQLGAHHIINYREENIADRVKEITKNKGVDLVLDCVGATQFKANERSLRKDARWVIYGLLSGAKGPDVGLSGLVMKRLTITGTTLRSRSDEYRGQLISEFMDRFGSEFTNDGRFRPLIHQEFIGLESASQAFECLATNTTIGKLVVCI